jgi:phosphohistidine phosphatase
VKRLTLVRHAKSEWPAHLEDFERPLSMRGRAEAATMAERAYAFDLLPDHIIASPAVRAITTAKAFAHVLGFPLPRIRHDDRVYLASVHQLLEVVRGAPPSSHHLMLFGHNPGLSEFAARLTGDRELGELPTAAIYSVSLKQAPWRELHWGSGQCTYYDFPDSLVERWD